MELIALFILIVSVVAAVRLAQQKNRDVTGWVVMTVLFFPLVAILYFLPPLEEPEAAGTEEEQREICPNCSKSLTRKGLFCQHCGSPFVN